MESGFNSATIYFFGFGWFVFLFLFGLVVVFISKKVFHQKALKKDEVVNERLLETTHFYFTLSVCAACVV